MQACYVNTTHPDFLNGHKVIAAASVMVGKQLTVNHQAMSMVSDKLNANKPQQTIEKGKLNNNKDLEVDVKKEEPGFFGSFWNQKTAGKSKKVGAATMEAVSTGGITCNRKGSSMMLMTTFSRQRSSSRNLL